MQFYYISVFSLALLGVIYFVGTGLLVWFASWLRKRRKRVWPIMVPLFALLYIGPIAEELWIAWNFGHLCRKDAGIFIYKTVEVDGFYYGGGAPFELIRSGGYRWAEGPSSNGSGAERLELADVDFARRARDRLDRVKGVTIKPGIYRVDVDTNTDALIFTTTGEVWRITKLDHPTARYHYRWPHMDTPMSYKVDKIERVVEDTKGHELLARETKYRRDAPWFYIGLDRPVMLCPAPGEHPLSQYGSVFNLALKPKKD